MRKRTTCIFVGAGFSAALFNQKIQNDFIDDLLNTKKLKKYTKLFKADFSNFKDVELLMSHYHNLAYTDLKDKEGLFGRKIISLRTIISEYYRLQYEKEFVCFNNCYKNLIKNIFIGEKAENTNYFIVTTNYDLGIETCLKEIYGSEESYYYPENLFFEENTIESDKIPIFKLHGSVNWFEERYFQNKSINFIKPLKISSRLNIERNHKISKKQNVILFKDSGKPAKYYSPILIPFFFQKEEWIGQRWGPLFENIWSNAKEYMENANKFYFIGYSLPSADHYIFSYLYKIFKVKKRDSITVIDINKDTTLVKLFNKVLELKAEVHDEGLVEYLKN